MADRIVLKGQARLSGTVKSIGADGGVELVSPLATGPVWLRGEAVEKVTFGPSDISGEPPTARVELANGDILPVEIESLDDQQLSVVSPVAGQLRIPRAALKSMQLGILPNRAIYSGPKSRGELRPEPPNEDSWSFENGVFGIQGEGRLTKKLDARPQFIARFTMEWENHPAMQFYFADPLVPTNEAADRYFFQFNGQGVEIKRESTEGRRFTTIVTLNRRPEQYPGRRLNVEIRLDRGNSLLYLYLNGEPEGRYNDPVANPPQAGGIAFISNAGDDSELRLSGIEVLEWDHAGDRHRTEDRGDLRADALIGKRGDRFGGKLMSIRKTAEGAMFSFKSDFQEAPIELPETEISTIFFQQPAETATEVFHPFALRLRGDGMLRVSSCSFPGDRIEAVHPLLGPLSFSRDGVMALERLEKKGGKP